MSMLINFNNMPGLSPVSAATPSFGDFSRVAGSSEMPLPGLSQFDSEFGAMDRSQAPPVGEDFSKMLKDAIDKVDAEDNKANSIALDMALGQNVDPHSVMIEYAKDSTMIHLASGISTKLAQDFTTLMNMQI